MRGRVAWTFPYLLTLPAVLPLVYVSGLVYPYITTKTFLLQTTGILALSAFAYLALSGHAFFYGRLRSRISWIPAALLGVAYATSALGIDFYRSFWGLFDRGDGLLTLTVITAFFYLILISADRQLFERLTKTVAVVAGLVALIAVLQWSSAALGGTAPFLPPVSGRIGSTFGNAAFLAGYLGMTLFVIGIALAGARGAWRRTYQVAAVLSVLAILLAATRGTILALLAAGVAALLLVALKGQGESKRFARYTLAALVVLAGFFFFFRSELAHAPIEPIRRIASISLSDGTVASRLFVWQGISREALRRPLLGYGAEHIDQLFDKIYNPDLIVEQWFDRSHNTFLDYFAQYGVFGLALYLALIGAFAVSAYRLYRRGLPGLTNAGFLLLLLILTYALQNFFVFDTPSSLWLLYALFAVLVVTLSDAPTTASRGMPPFISVLVSALVLLLIVPAVILPFYANILLTRGYLFHVVDVAQANGYLKRGLAVGTYADLEYGYQAYSMYTDNQAVQLVGSERIAAYEYALSVLSANFEKYPYDARTATYLGHVIDTAPPEVAVDDEFDKSVLARAIELSPLRAQAWYMTANIHLRRADSLGEGSAEQGVHLRKAIAVLEEYAQKATSLPVPRYILATLYYKLGDTAAARKWADEGYPLYTEIDLAAARPALKYYLAVGDWQKAVRFLGDIAVENPSDTAVLYDLAKVTYLAGDPATALAMVRSVRERDPSILQTDPNFLAAITAYEQSRGQ